MFENIEQQIWYDTYFLTKTIISEMHVIYEDFEHIGVRQNLEARGWLNYVKTVGLLMSVWYVNSIVMLK